VDGRRAGQTHQPSQVLLGQPLEEEENHVDSLRVHRLIHGEEGHSLQGAVWKDNRGVIAERAFAS